MMDDLRQRFASLDSVPMPDLLGDIERRAANQASVSVRAVFLPERASSRPWLRLAIVALALIALVGAVVVGAGVIVQPHPPLPSVRVAQPSIVVSPLPSTAELPSPSVATTALSTIGRFVRSGDLLEGRYRHAATALPDGRVLVAGGQGANDQPHRFSYLASLEVWDVATGRFGTAGSMVIPDGWDAFDRFGMYAFPTADGRALLVPVGCACKPPPGAPAEIWDPADGSIHDLTNLHILRYGFTVTQLADGRLLVAGGNLTLQSRSTKAAEVWDPVADTATSSRPLRAARWGAVAAPLADGRVLMIGGEFQAARGEPGGGAILSADLWDPATKTFTPAFALNAPIASRTHVADGATALTLRDGRVLVLDGIRGRVWDAASGGGFVKAGSLLTPRLEYTATVLADGRVLVIGGRDPRNESAVPLRTTELWDPEAGRFDAGPDLMEARFGHTATLLPDGRVLVIGGAAQQGLTFDPRTSAEIWEP